MLIREPLRTPSHHQEEEEISSQPLNVSVHHPFYKENNMLLQLCAFDDTSGGIHHGTLHAASAIIANNRFDGYLSETRAPGVPLTALHNDVLLLDKYYFHVPDDPEYAVVPTFRHWQFPHNRIPQSWTELGGSTRAPAATAAHSDMSFAVRLRDSKCRVSGYLEGLQIAHLCPQAEEPWANRNEMGKFAVNPLAQPGHWINNALCLRADLHFAFDQRRFVLLPKSDKLVVHVLEASRELLRLYHNIEIQPSTNGLGVGVAFLFSRFAWTIFNCTTNTSFSRSTDRRRLAFYNPATKETINETIFMSDVPKLDESRSRSQSPKKRLHSNRSDPTERREQDQKGCEALLRDPAPASLPRIPKRKRESSISLSSDDVEENTHDFTRASREASESLSSSRPFICDSQATQQGQPCEEQSCPDVNLISEAARIQALREEALCKERKSSDVNNVYEEEQSWLEKAINRPHSAQSMTRLLEAMGYEILTD